MIFHDHHGAGMSAAVSGREAHGGFSLLEVLVACGILIFALSGIAAILPAASSRLADAAAEDRAGAVAANAHAEILSRGVATAQRFADASVTMNVLAFGQPLVSAIVTLGKSGTGAVPVYGMKEFWADSPSRGFLGEDELEFTVGSNGILTSVYESVNALGEPTAARRFKSGVCWGAMLTHNSPAPPVARGTRATLSIAVFRKSPEARLITATSASTGSKNGMYQLPANQGTVRSTFARPCSYLLVIPPNSSNRPPKWLRVNSSWTRLKDQVPFVVFADDPGDISIYEAGGSLTLIGFSSLIRVDEYPIVLE